MLTTTRNERIDNYSPTDDPQIARKIYTECHYVGAVDQRISRYDRVKPAETARGKRGNVYGFPMNFSYAEIPVILERVKAKGIHELLGPDYDLDFGDSTSLFRASRSLGDSQTTLRDSSLSRSMLSSSVNLQFALAVYVKAYSGPVLSIWVYLAALWRRPNT
ncbi:unnamed protein product [Echinostoma caproni]|uniref:Poly(ADP-ribose) glycohydrolase n=1 Tax=Echinostoma caproni TaxID=27848 RepID=A0A183AYF0_9TREM|nr:unnamed protein product [Echinostoma caproni]